MEMNAGIIGIGRYIPEKVVTNFDLEKMMDTSDEWIRTRTGIEERRIASDRTGTSDMAYEASLRALENAGITGEDIGRFPACFRKGWGQKRPRPWISAPPVPVSYTGW